MLSIQPDQFDSLAEHRFEQRLIGLLQTNDESAVEFFATHQGRHDLRRQVAQAREYGMYSELDIARYVITAWKLGADFDDRFPAMSEILAADRLTPSQKAETLEAICVQVLADLLDNPKGSV